MDRILVFLGVLILSLIFVPVDASAQKQNSHVHMSKEVQEFKVKFLAQEIDLEDSKVKKFAEIYNRMQNERAKIFFEVRSLEKQLRAKKNATEDDYLKVNQAKTDARIKDAEVEKKYDKELSEILTKKQLFKLKEAEKTFRDKMHKMRKEKMKK